MLSLNSQTLEQLSLFDSLQSTCLYFKQLFASNKLFLPAKSNVLILRAIFNFIGEEQILKQQKQNTDKERIKHGFLSFLWRFQAQISKKTGICECKLFYPSECVSCFDRWLDFLGGMSFLLSHRKTAVVKSNARNKLHHSRGFPSQSGEICEAIFSLSFSNRGMAQFSAAEREQN